MILKSDPETREVFSSIFFRSGYYVLIAYFLALLLEKIIMFFGALYFGYQIKFDYEYLQVRGDYHDWSQESVLIIYLFPNLIFAAMLVWLHLKSQKFSEKKPEFSQIFLYWIIFFFTYRIIGMLPAHLVASTGIYHAFSWLYMGQMTEILLASSCLILFFIIAVWLLHRIFYLNARINDNLEVTGMPLLLFSSFALPAAMLCGVAVLFFLPGLPKEEILGLIFIALPVIFTFIRLIYLKPAVPLSNYYVEEIFEQWQIYVAVAVLIVLIRVGLIFGICIGCS